MNILDETYALARHLKETEEYQEYIRLKEVAYEDATNQTLLNEYKRLQFRLQSLTASGEQPSNEDIEKLTRIASLLQLNEDARNYLLAELRFQRILADVYKILGEVAGIDLDALAQA
ncbi:MAG: YlbF family regulator [Clostridia bacterium]|nr:YlbF family regulator [Clostridia bacterium]